MADLKSNAFSQKALRTKAPPISWLMKLALQRPQLISLAAGFTDSPSLPAREIREILDDLWKHSREVFSALQYGSTQGDESLREWTRTKVAQSDKLKQIQFSTDQIVIGNGSQQLLSIVTEILCDPDDIILLEDPTYFVYMGILESCGIQAVPFTGIPQLRERLAWLESEGKMERVKLAYLVSYFRNPTGTTHSLQEKKDILDLLRKQERHHPIYILEDAAYRDMRFEGEDIPSFLHHDPAAERTLYAATYTKPFATGLKVGYAIAPTDLVAPILRFKGNEDFGTSNFDQQILRHAVCDGHYQKHLEKLRQVYRNKAEVMATGLKKHFPKEASWSFPSGGLYFWIHLPESVDCGMKSKIFQASLNSDVLYVPGELCYAQSPLRERPRHQMRLSFGNASLEQIQEGVKRLGEVLKKYI